MSTIESTCGIIIRQFEYSNTSLIVHLLSPDKGVVHLLARGAKSPKSLFSGKLELFQEVSCQYITSAKSDLYILKECSRETIFKKAARDIAVFAVWSFMIELISAMPWDTTESEKIFALLKSGFLFYEDEPPTLYHQGLIFFMAKLIMYLGYTPELNRCCRSNRPLSDTVLPVTYPQPGFICAGIAKPLDREKFPSSLPSSLLGKMHQLFMCADYAILKNIVLSDEEIKQVFAVFLFFVHSISGKKFKSLSLLMDMGLTPAHNNGE